jgi:hypothetical protein
MKNWIFSLLFASVAVGDIPNGTYRLSNHPDGNENPPPYGLRLDGLDGNPGHVFSFDFDTEGSEMFMNLTNDTIRIHGTVYGGLNKPSNHDIYADPSNKERNYMVGLWEVDFTYRDNVGVVNGDDDRIVSASSENNNGTITFLNENYRGQTTFGLVDFMSPSFRFGNENNDRGHRGFNGLSGWGWMNHDGYPSHVDASDWLFTAHPIPVSSPLSLAIMGIAIAGIGIKKFRLV